MKVKSFGTRIILESNSIVIDKIRWIYGVYFNNFKASGKIAANSRAEAIKIITELYPLAEKIEAVEAVWIDGELAKLYYWENLLD